MNDLILSELIPSLSNRKENELVDLLQAVTKTTLNIDWGNIVKLQTINLKNGLNNIGIPDLIIVQNAVQNNLSLYTVDKHFALMKPVH